MFTQLFLVLAYAGIAQGPFVALLLNSPNVRKSRANLFLSILLLCLSFSIAHILHAGHVLNHFSVKVYSFGDPTFLLIAPLLWFYTAELTGRQVKLGWTLLAHFTPFFFIVFCSLTFGAGRAGGITSFLLVHHRLLNILFWVGVVIQFSCYQVFIHRRWSAYQLFIRQEVSNPENLNISWVRFFMGVFLIINLFFLFSLFVVIHFDGRQWIWQLTAIVFSLSVFALGYKGILQKEIFYSEVRDSKREPDPEIVKPSPQKYDQAVVEKLLLHMRDKKPFLDPELTLSSLARQLELSRGQLSQLINDGLGSNFYDFVNRYRVDEVKRLLADPRSKHLSLLGIALDAGFKSKSTFNLVFKRFTGLTPTEYKNNLAE